MVQGPFLGRRWARGPARIENGPGETEDSGDPLREKTDQGMVGVEHGAGPTGKAGEGPNGVGGVRRDGGTGDSWVRGDTP